MVNKKDNKYFINFSVRKRKINQGRKRKMRFVASRRNYTNINIVQFETALKCKNKL